MGDSPSNAKSTLRQRDNRPAEASTEGTVTTELKAPFPWFGGKSRAAPIIWPRFGDVPNYVEPFAGSLATLLLRPHPPRVETVNDLDCYLANFWRAIACDPEGVAEAADWPVNEADLTARHRWLMAQSGFRDRMRTESDYFDVKVAGWWVWGLCHMGDAGMAIRDYFSALSERLRKVRVACGEWDRVLGDSTTIKHGTTAVLLDPPYDEAEHSVTYSAQVDGISARVRAWAIANGENPLLRIALCGYKGEPDMPAGWECVAWKAKGGYGSQGSGTVRENSKRERIWFSPACLKPNDDLFANDGTVSANFR
jgi:hypothetical protein